MDVDYEPTRVLLNNGPPKRFYRTIWRFIAWKILEIGSMSKISGSVSQDSLKGNDGSDGDIRHRTCSPLTNDERFAQ
jgi:hypothetical protein